MTLNNRDNEILNYIGRFGVLDILAFESLYDIKRQTVYKILKRLINKQYVTEIRLGYRNKKAYILSEKGNELKGFSKKNISNARVNYELKFNLLSILIVKKYSYEFITKREILRVREFGSEGHLPIMIFHQGSNKFAVEYFIKKPKKEYLKELDKWYKYGIEDYKKGLYFCEDSAYLYIKNNVKNDDINVINIDKYIQKIKDSLENYSIDYDRKDSDIDIKNIKNMFQKIKFNRENKTYFFNENEYLDIRKIINKYE